MTVYLCVGVHYVKNVDYKLYIYNFYISNSKLKHVYVNEFHWWCC